MRENSQVVNPESLKMFTREEVAELFSCHVTNVAMLTEIGCLPAIKIGKRFMYSQQTIMDFENDYLGQDLSNRKNALRAKSEIER